MVIISVRTSGQTNRTTGQARIITTTLSAGKDIKNTVAPAELMIADRY